MDAKKFKKDLEETIKEKISPLLEETMKKKWGITIPKIETDISDKLKNPGFNIYIPADLNFLEAKQFFKKEFFKTELRLHKGNISQLAKNLGLDRRSIHRTIKELSINIEDLRANQLDEHKYQQNIIDKAIRSTLEQYEGIIKTEQMEKMYQEIPNLSENIAKVIPLQEITWKEAEQEFEHQFLEQVLKDNARDIEKTSTKIGLKMETLQRKIKKLKI